MHTPRGPLRLLLILALPAAQHALSYSHVGTRSPCIVMYQPQTKRRRMDENSFLDIEAAVDRADELEVSEDETNRAFIDDDEAE
ncbi:hypothetical protein D9619_013616 [Psilocybe cf. subviscida]|uniref:Uncharacterized protein n=1 Tax=Psilocybe cf. subviscida TaxID=2480587 RepID=A0A8H5BR71_9AGAR|nr:hypothetical protein D9619_013616 [Psilocybe cf. subviscida]